jgi:hypothetical protein
MVSSFFVELNYEVLALARILYTKQLENRIIERTAIVSA